MSKNDRIVTRFAPSPTGYMHVGNLRTALYSYLIAKANNGRFILRIEDTDRERLVSDAVNIIIKTLKDTGLIYDEGPDIGGEHGPYIQSERKDIYLKYAKELMEKGSAYYCFCDKERLDMLQNDSTVSGYDRHCRNLSQAEIEKSLSENKPFVIRQKMPLEGSTSFVDLVFGEINTDNSELQDQILLKADGYPTYNFAHVVDDYLMGVTHVVRGSEYLTSTPKYVLLYDAFGWERPNYVHLPLMMGRSEDGTVSKLSKRHGSVSFQDLVASGYLPEAILNYIALLGWNPKNSNQEIYTLDELCKVFSIEGINKSAPVFDYDKLKWINSKYIQSLPFDEYLKLAAEFESDFLKDHPCHEKIGMLLQGRISAFNQINDMACFFEALPDYGVEKFLNKKNKVTRDNARPLLEMAIDTLQNMDSWNNDALYSSLSKTAEDNGYKVGSLMWVIRIAISGLEATPGGATEIMEILGKQETMNRLNYARKKLEKDCSVSS